MSVLKSHQKHINYKRKTKNYKKIEVQQKQTPTYRHELFDDNYHIPDLVIQKRFDGSVEFNRNWKNYENGFGDKNGEFWLGNKNIAQLTSEGNHELRIDVEDWDGKKHYAVYGKFSIGDASTKYRLTISNYSGNAGDGMSYYNGMKFTTYDQDNDRVGGNCAANFNFKGGWWYKDCWTGKEAMVNGHYTGKNNSTQGIIYRTVGKHTKKKSTMKIRKV